MKPKHWVSIALTVVTVFAGYQQYTYTSYLLAQHLPEKLVSETNVIALEIESFVHDFSSNSPQKLPVIENSELDYSLTIGSNLGESVDVKQMSSLPMGSAPGWFNGLFATDKLNYSRGFYVDKVKKGTLSTRLSPSPIIDSAWRFFCYLGVGYLAFLLLLLQALNRQEHRHKIMISRFAKGIHSIENGSYKLIKQMQQDFLFKELVIDFNQLIGQLEQQKNAIVKEKKQLSYAVQYDELTGLPNRQLFKIAMAKLLDQTMVSGHLLMLRLISLEQVNQELGFREGDAYISKITSLLVRMYGSKNDDNQVFRINGRDIIVLLPQASRTQREMWAEELKTALTELDNNLYRQGCGCFTITEYRQDSVVDDLLIKLDSGLSQAMLKSANNYSLIDYAQFTQLASNKWFEIVTNIIEAQSITLTKQQLKHRASNPKLYNFELFATFEYQLQSYSAHDVFSAANRFSLCPHLDRIVIDKAFMLAMGNSFSSARYMVSLSYDSVLDEEFEHWLSYRLKKQPHIASQLVFKLPERSVVNKFELVRRFIESLHLADALVCLDYEGSQYSHQLSRSIGELNVDMIKVNGHYTHRVDSYGERASFVSSLVAAAHSINVPVIASQVEQDAEWTSLVELGVDAVQGNLFGHVRPV